MLVMNEHRAGNILLLEDFAAALPDGGRLIGIDVGTKTLGLALSDVNRSIASGLVETFFVHGAPLLSGVMMRRRPY